jgi:N-acyl-L-homoserine lactone synthetase
MSVSEGQYVARLLTAADSGEMARAQNMRHGYFVQKKAWVESDAENTDRETDRYDGLADHLAVFDGERMLAYVRVLPWLNPVGFMLERDFRCLMHETAIQALDREHGREISRLVLAPDISPDAVLPVSELLFKLLYRSCRSDGANNLYAVIEPAWLRRFNNCFKLSFRALGRVYRFPDGTRAVAAGAHMEELERSLLAADPLKLAWYQRP